MIRRTSAKFIDKKQKKKFEIGTGNDEHKNKL